MSTTARRNKHELAETEEACRQAEHADPDSVAQQVVQTRRPHLQDAEESSIDDDDDSDSSSVTEGSAASQFEEVFDCTIRGVGDAAVAAGGSGGPGGPGVGGEGEGGPDVGPRIQVLGSYRGSDFDFQVKSNLNCELTYDGQQFLFPSLAVVGALLLSSALSMWLVFYGLPLLCSAALSSSSSFPLLSQSSTSTSNSASASKLGFLLHPRTLDDYGTLWLTWHAVVYLYERAWHGNG